MSESQFEKLLKTLERTERENKQLCEENGRLRGLLKGCQPYIEGSEVCDTRLCDAVKKELNDEPE